MITETKELWKPIEGYDGLYEVCSDGRIRGLRSGIILRGFPNKNNGYHQVMLYDLNGKNKLCYTHIIVAKAFLPEPLNGETLVTHINGNKLDNSVKNLIWKHQSIKKNIELSIPDGRIDYIKNKQPEFAYIIKRYNEDGKCMAVYNGWKILELQGYKKNQVINAAKNRYMTKRGNVYKKYKWTVEKVVNNG